MRLATRGQQIVKPIDALRDPLVLEFLGMPESPRLVESQLEQTLINDLQSFLLELGKGSAIASFATWDTVELSDRALLWHENINHI